MDHYRLGHIISTTDSIANIVKPSTKEKNEEIILVWFDKNTDAKSNDVVHIKEILYQINDYVICHQQTDTCIQYIESIKNEKIFLVCSGSSSTDILSNVHKLQQIDTIFILCTRKENNDQLIQQYPKIIGIFTDIETLIKNIQYNIVSAAKQLAIFNLYNEKQKSTRDLSRESAEFLWFQMLKDVLLNLPQTLHAKEEMLSKCRDYYHQNKRQLENIDKFEQTYEPTKAIEWYTSTTFIYKQVNQALRTENIDLLYLFRFYIVDLCKMLQQEYLKLKNLQKSRNILNFTLYRGLRLALIDVENMRKNIGSLISTNGFLSTTRDIDVAYIYAGIGMQANDDKIPILFTINVNIQSQTNILADIGEISKISDESEVLFDLGSTFKINNVYYDTAEQFWRVEMTTTDEGETIINEYLTNTRNKALQSTNILTFGYLLLNMGEPHKAQQYYSNLLPYGKESNASIYHMLGLAYSMTQDYSKALDNMMHARDLFMNAVPPNLEFVAHTTFSIANIFYHQKQYKQSLEFFNMALKMYSKVNKNKTTNEFVNVWMKLGDVYHEMNSNRTALKMYNKAMKAQEKLIPSINDPIMADLYEKISSVYSRKGKYNKAIEAARKSLHIKEQIYPPVHPFIGEAYNHLSTIYILIDDHKEALEYVIKKKKIYETIYPAYHPLIMYAEQQIAMLKNNIELKDRKMQLELHLKELKSMKKVQH
ncbi:unnamed protein product [Rotaria sp. Silwood1]|nr:unnamed protein product [Rotaria sp. Silwood1]